MALCLCECVCSCLRAMCFATEGPWIQPEASLFSVFAHWLNWLMKCSVIQSGEKILTTAMKHNHRGLHWRRVCVREMLAESHYSGSISCEHLFCLCSKDIIVCLCVYGLLPAWLQGLSQSINPHTVHQQPRWLPPASCRYSLQLFSIRVLLTPWAGSATMPALDMSRFQRE